MDQVEFRTTPQGYVEFRNGDEQPWMLRHRWIMAQVLGRPLLPGEEVHHLDGNKTNNAPSNLAVVTPAVHRQLHKLPHACYRCGRMGHWVADCYATFDIGGNPLPAQGQAAQGSRTRSSGRKPHRNGRR